MFGRRGGIVLAIVQYPNLVLTAVACEEVGWRGSGWRVGWGMLEVGAGTSADEPVRQALCKPGGGGLATCVCGG